jgi:hypothetical protein
MIAINLPKINHEFLLRNAGYIPQRKGNGFIRDLTIDTRFHALSIGDYIEIHYDKTIKGRHVVVRAMNLLRPEKVRLEVMINVLWLSPSMRHIPKKKRMKVEYAPNLRELQRNIGKVNQKPPRLSIVRRLLSLISTTITRMTNRFY